MSSLVNRFKSSANKAAFEADKLRRGQMAQLAIRPLRNEVSRLYSEMGELAYLLYTQEAISQPELCTIGERLAEVHAQISAAEAEVERIRAEEYIEPPPDETSQTNLSCPNGHGVLAEGTSFCQECGAAGMKPVPLLPPPVTIPCQHCGNAVGLNMRFCPTCGMLTGERPMAEQSSNDQSDTSGHESPDLPEQNT
jgi:hypothetical protein